MKWIGGKEWNMTCSLLSPEVWGAPGWDFILSCAYILRVYMMTHAPTHIYIYMYIHTDMYVRGNVRACATRSRVCNVMQAAPVTSSSLHPPVQVWWRLRAIKSSLLHEQFLLITSTQPTVANDPITSVVPPFLSPPPPSSLFFAPPIRCYWFILLCGGCSASADVSTGTCPEGPEAPRQASEYLLACLSVFLSFALSVHSCILPTPCFCALTIQSSLNTAELMNLIST